MTYIMFYMKGQPLTETLAFGMKYYRERYGEPTVCLVNPASIDELKGIDAPLEIKADPYVLTRNLYIGCFE